MSEQIIEELEKNLKKSVDHLHQEYRRLQIGRASPALVEHLEIDVYSSKTPIRNLAAINTPDVKTITIAPWDKNVLRNIEKAILDSDLGINPINDGTLIRLTMPEMTEEKRKEIAKIVHKLAEETRVSIRNSRQASHNDLKKKEQNKEISEDEFFKLEKLLQEKVDFYNKKTEELASSKEKDVMTV